MEVAPGAFPAGGDLLSGDGPESTPDLRLAAGADICHELDVAALHTLLEALGAKLQENRPRLLGPSRGHSDRRRGGAACSAKRGLQPIEEALALVVGGRVGVRREVLEHAALIVREASRDDHVDEDA